MTARPAVYIVAARRTPIGKFMGGLARVPAPVLGSYVAKALFEAVPGAQAHVDECIMGHVLQAGVGQNPARQVAILGGLPDTMRSHRLRELIRRLRDFSDTNCGSDR